MAGQKEFMRLVYLFYSFIYIYILHMDYFFSPEEQNRWDNSMKKGDDIPSSPGAQVGWYNSMRKADNVPRSPEAQALWHKRMKKWTVFVTDEGRFRTEYKDGFCSMFKDGVLVYQMPFE